MRLRIGSGLARLVMATVVSAGVAIGTLTAGIAETPAAAASLQPIVVGDICSCTGPEQASLSQTTPTLQAWASYVNAHGGIAGHKVELVVKDDAYNPSTSLSEVKAMVENNHVAVLVDNSDVDNAWGTYVEQNSVPVVGGQISDLGYANPMFFVPSATYNYLPDGMAAIAKSVGLKKLANLYCAEVVACSQSSSGLKTAASKIGLSVSYATSISFSAPSYTAQCLASQQSGADAMVVGDATPIVSKIAEECASQGYKPTEVSADGTVASSWLSIPAMEGNVDTQEQIPWFVHNSVTKPFYDALAKYAPGVATGPNFGEINIEVWADGALLQAAGKTGKLNASTVTPADITAAMYALPKGTTLGGLAPPLTFKKGQPSNNDCFFRMKIANHKFVLLNGGAVSCIK